MNISSQISLSDGSNFSDYFFYNSTDVEADLQFARIAVDIIIILLVLPINSYVIWLIVTGTGNGLAAEFFSLNIAVCEMLFCINSFCNFISFKVEHFWIAENILYGLALTGRALFQCLICVERYVAVVHPVTFLKYKPLRYRVICSVTVWVASCVSSGISVMNVFLILIDFYNIFIITQFFLYLCIQLFCLVAVLRALKQSGPGERARERDEENHMKRRAFYIILITTMTMLIMYVPYIIVLPLDSSSTVVIILSLISFGCFTSAGLVQPLLFLYRVGKLPFIKCQ